MDAIRTIMLPNLTVKGVEPAEGVSSSGQWRPVADSLKQEQLQQAEAIAFRDPKNKNLAQTSPCAPSVLIHAPLASRPGLCLPARKDRS